MKRLAEYFLILLTLLAAASLTSCGSSAKMTARKTHNSAKHRPSRKPVASDIKIDPMLPADTRQLLAEARSWLGVPYVWGGNDRSGVDCSGFVTQVFLNALQIKLPRTSASQSEYCAAVDRRKLQPGDLLFFDTTGAREGRVSHVGLYIGDGNMIHASTSKGVTVSAIDGVYFGERLLKAGRVGGTGAEVASEPNVRPKRKKQSAPSSPSVPPPAAPLPQVSAKPAGEAVRPQAAAAASPDEARSLVLDMLVEQKLDSIYSH